MGRAACPALRLLLAASATAGAAGSANGPRGVVELNKFNYANVDSGTWFVKFFAPWCVHCKRLAPVWDDLAKAALNGGWPLRIAEVDCSRSSEVCQRNQIIGYPTLSLITDGQQKGQYKGAPMVDAMQEWIGKQLGQPVGMLQQGAGQAGASAAASSKLAASRSSRGVKDVAGVSDTFSMAARIKRSEILRLYVDGNLAQFLWHFFKAFPTRNELLNLYIYCLSGLAGLVWGLFALLHAVEALEAKAEEEERDAERRHQQALRLVEEESAAFRARLLARKLHGAGKEGNT